jgi:Serine/threonine protein kinase
MECWYCKKIINDTNNYCECVHPKLGFPTPLRFREYIVKDYLGSGQFGSVFKCFDSTLERNVAIKKLDPKTMPAGRSAKEMQAIARINNPNVVQIYHSVLEENFFVMEYVDGGTLKDAIEKDNNFIINNFIPFALDVCEGLRAAHRERICHRDLKTENILLTKDKKPKISDFGLAQLITSSYPGIIPAGTLLYMAPEILNNEFYDLTVDIYSLGVIFYKIWTGQYPFEASTPIGLSMQIVKGDYEEPKKFNSHIPDHINTLIKQMICPKERRINSISLVASALEPDKLRPIAGNKILKIDDYQKELMAIYGHKNYHRLPIILLDYFSTNLSALMEGLRSCDLSYRKERSEKYFPKSFAWLCAVYTSLGVYLSEILWFKFPNKCPYCDNNICKCESLLAHPKADINNELLKKINTDGLASSQKEESFSFYQKMFKRIYGQKNQIAGIDSVSLHAFFEIDEARDAMLKIDSLERFRNKDIWHLELADLTAWFFALLNLYDENYDFEIEFQEFFQGKCYVCKREICICPDRKTIPLFFW